MNYINNNFGNIIIHDFSQNLYQELTYKKKGDKVKISKLGQGLPVGGEIEQFDDGTLISAFRNRGPVSTE